MPNDPATGRPLPESAIQRILFQTPGVHVYGIPPITSSRGFSASSWTHPTTPTAQQIFTARVRIFETSLPDRPIKVDICLEDPATGDLFAAAPYTAAAVVQQANDSSRFFAVRVVGEGGMKATLGIGFEERGPALDFNIALAEAAKVVGFGGQAGVKAKSGSEEEILKKDFSLKEGERIHIEVGGRGRRVGGGETVKEDTAALFSIAPPPGPAPKAQNDLPAIAPPPATTHTKTAQELGFDDDFGDFQ